MAVKDFKFSNGTTIPAGTLLSLPMYATHRDEAIYSDPDVFDPYRFLKLRADMDETKGARYQMAASNVENLTWGLGRHVWCVAFHFSYHNS